MMNCRLLKLFSIPCLLLVAGCGGGEDSSSIRDDALCSGQQIETITVTNENREGMYTTTQDIITGECVAPADQLERGFEVSIDDYSTNVNLDVAASLLSRSEKPITLATGVQALRWVDTFENLSRDGGYTHNEGSFNTGGVDLEIEFLISEKGYFRATTIADDDVAHLAIFGTSTGQINYIGFNDAPLRVDAYSSSGPRSRYNSKIAQANILAQILSRIYARLALEGALSNKLANYAELYRQSPTTIKSFFKRNVFVMRSFIYHNRIDYDDIEDLEKPPVQEWNKLWSPFGDEDRDPAQTLMSRSYGVDYKDGANLDSLTYLETWSGSHTLAARTSIRVSGHYLGDLVVDHSVQEPGSIFNIQCSSAISGCELSTSRNAGVAVYVQGLAPTRVEMEMNNDWALGHTAVITATFSDWDTYNRDESPLRTNPNPKPAVVPPSSPFRN